MVEQDSSGELDAGEASGARHALILSLRSRDAVVRRQARKQLTQQGQRALRQLVPLLAESNEDVRCEAAKALADIADPSSTPHLVAALEDTSGEVRLLAAVGLVAIGPAALVPLLHVLRERADSVPLREGAHHVLQQLSSDDSRRALAPVLAALQADDPDTRVREPIRAAVERIRKLRS